MEKLYSYKKISYFVILLSGVVSSLSLPPYNLFWLNFLTLPLFFTFLVRNKNLKHIEYLIYGWLFGFGYFLSSLYWISISLTFDSDFKILIPLSIIIIPSFLALFFAFSTFIVSFFSSYKSLSLILVFSFFLGTFEFIRGSIFTGFPWNLFVFSFSNNISFLQSLSIFGTYGLNLLCISFFLIPSILFLKTSKFEYLTSLIIVILFFSFFSFGNYRLDRGSFSNLENDQMIKVLSSKVKIERFYTYDNEEEIIKELISLSNPKKEIKSIFVWPEGVLTSTYLKDIKKFESLFKKNFSKNHLIILGINDLIENNKENIFNSLVVLDNELRVKALYHKNKLVPFGEFLPFEGIIKGFGVQSFSNLFKSFSAGEKREIIQIGNLKILPLICYEIIYSGKLSNEKNYDIIINISEDGWFGKSIGPHQHFAHSIFRSIEEGKAVIRSSNHGISTYIDPYGKIFEFNESTESGVSVSKIKKLDKNTLFSKHGNNMFFYLLLIYISLIFFLKKFGR